MNRTLSRRSFSVLAASKFATHPALAGGLPTPKEKVILTVSGRIDQCNDGNVMRFDRPMLEALGVQSFITKTPWYKNPTCFEGVLMRTLLQVVGASGDWIAAVALNDYMTEIPVVDFKRYNVLLALKRDGAYMLVRDKGPLFIVYPFDSSAELQAQKFYSRSAWQLAEIIVR